MKNGLRAVALKGTKKFNRKIKLIPLLTLHNENFKRGLKTKWKKTFKLNITQKSLKKKFTKNGLKAVVLKGS